MGEENLVDGGVDLGADLGPVVASLAALGTDSIRKTYGQRYGLKNSNGTYSNSGNPSLRVSPSSALERG